MPQPNGLSDESAYSLGHDFGVTAANAIVALTPQLAGKYLARVEEERSSDYQGTADRPIATGYIDGMRDTLHEYQHRGDETP